MTRHTQIENADISIRLKNCCKAAGIHTIGQLVDMPYTTLLKYHGFGRVTLGEVERIKEAIL